MDTKKTYRAVFSAVCRTSLILAFLLVTSSSYLYAVAERPENTVKFPSISDASYYSKTAASLEKRKRELTPHEMARLADIYWAMYYPDMTLAAGQACDMMGEAVKYLSAGADIDKLRIVYADMLNKTSRQETALRQIETLLHSADNETRLSAHILKADLYNTRKKFNDAYTEILRINGDFNPGTASDQTRARYYSVMGDAYSGLNEYSKALEMYDKALALDGSIHRFNPDIYLKKGIALYRTDDTAGALSLLEKAVNLGTPSSRSTALIYMGDCLSRQRNEDNAYALYYEASKIKSPAAVPAALRMAAIIENRYIASDKALNSRTYMQLSRIYKKALSDYPDSLPVVAYSMAGTDAAYGNITQAFRMYYKAWGITGTEDPVHTYSRQGASNLLKRLVSQDSGKWDAIIINAYVSYQDSLFRDISDPSVLIRLSNLLLEAGYINDASKIAYRLPAKESDLLRFKKTLLLIEIETRKGHLSRALELADNCLKFSGPDTPRAVRTKKAELLLMLGRNKDASEYLENPENVGKDDLPTLRLKAYLYQLRDETEKEMKVYDDMIRLGNTRSPVVEQALFIRACSLAEAEPSRAYGLFSKLVKEYPDSAYFPQAVFFMAGTANELGYSVDIGLIEKALQSNRDPIMNTAINLRLKEIYMDKALKRYFKPETVSVKIPALLGDAGGRRN